MKRLIVFTILLSFLLAFPSLVYGYLLECGPDGNDPCIIGAYCPPNRCSGSSENVCCRTSGGCDLNGEPAHIDIWTYAYNATCRVHEATDINYQCKYYWQREICGVQDRCGPCAGESSYVASHVCAGRCNDYGCSTGGWYKTCCVDGQPIGQCSGGRCSVGTITAAEQTQCSSPTNTPGPSPTSGGGGGGCAYSNVKARSVGTAIKAALSLWLQHVATT